MDIRSELLKEHSKSVTERIVAYVGDDKKRMQELMKSFLSGDQRLSQRSAWPLSYIGISHPLLLTPYEGRLMELLQQAGIHDAIKRNILRIWGESMPSETRWGELFDCCYRLAHSKDEAVAIRTFAMKVMSNIVLKYPELTLELKSLAEDLIMLGQPAFVSRGKKILSQLDKASRKKSAKTV